MMIVITSFAACCDGGSAGWGLYATYTKRKASTLPRISWLHPQEGGGSSSSLLLILARRHALCCTRARLSPPAALPLYDAPYGAASRSVQFQRLLRPEPRLFFSSSSSPPSAAAVSPFEI